MATTHARERSVARLRDGHGFATVWGITWIVVVLSIGWVCLLVAVAVAQQHRVDGAADLVALSGAAALQDGADGCRVAATIAAKNQVSLVACDLDGSDVLVEVSGVLRLPLGISGRLVSHARAGPSA